MKFTIENFIQMFPNNDVCLEYIFKLNYPSCEGYHRIRKRLAFVNNKGHQIYPLKGTIFEKSRTSLTKWFFAMYIFHISKNGISAKELQRYLGVTYKTAWRMAMKIRELMEQDDTLLKGVVEADETYIGGKRRSSNRYSNKSITLGIVERGGQARARVIAKRDEFNVIPFIERNVRKNTKLFTDEACVYQAAWRYRRSVVNHSKFQYVNGDVHTNTIEGFWGQLKRSINGTFHSISKKYLQKYLNEFIFRYNYRNKCFDELLLRI